MEQPLLEKYECLFEECKGSFLVNKDSSQQKDLVCPFCTGVAEATVHENEDSEERGLVYGCLFPHGIEGFIFQTSKYGGGR
ncbi:hypothetical protein [Paenibacillus sp. NPDC057934]|uniref:hypothetical protein n=1 Tax=Paenibacillus sp. NPDC057934 TaxID=3346282 RepID=UPI0036DDAC7C